MKKLNKITFLIESFGGVYWVLVTQSIFTTWKTSAMANALTSILAVYATVTKFSVLSTFLSCYGGIGTVMFISFV